MIMCQRKLGCSFCRRGAAEVNKLVAGPRMLLIGPRVHICDQCIGMAQEISTNRRGLGRNVPRKRSHAAQQRAAAALRRHIACTKPQAPRRRARGLPRTFDRQDSEGVMKPGALVERIVDGRTWLRTRRANPVR